MNIDDKLNTLKYKPADESHIEVNQSDCLVCKSRPCTYFCPANVYSWDEEQKKLIVSHENCLECGACRIGCVAQSIVWEYPKGGRGVTFKQG